MEGQGMGVGDDAGVNFDSTGDDSRLDSVSDSYTYSNDSDSDSENEGQAPGPPLDVSSTSFSGLNTADEIRTELLVDDICSFYQESESVVNIELKYIDIERVFGSDTMGLGHSFS